MILEKKIMPCLMLDSFRDVTPALLRELNKKLLICDIDNTLVTYDDPEPTSELMTWFEDLKSDGVTVAFVSNNHAERVELFNKSLGYTAYADAHKPSGKYIKAVIEKHGISRVNTALLGDQLLTDAAAASNAGIFSIIVPPIKDKKNLFFKSKRLIEKPYVRKYKKLHNK